MKKQFFSKFGKKVVLGGVILTALSLGYNGILKDFNYRNLSPLEKEENAKIIYMDFNRDGRMDFELKTKEDDKFYIRRSDGTYDVCRSTIQDGIPFYKTIDGKFTYDTWGGRWDRKIKDGTFPEVVDVKLIKNIPFNSR